MPDYLHPAIQWTKSQPYKLSESHDVLWHIPKDTTSNRNISRKNKNDNAYTAADGSIPIYPINDKVDLGKKHKSNDLDKIKIKKQKTQSSYTEGSHHDKSEIVHIQSSVNDVVICPKGLVWDNTNYSCAYDAFVSILYQLWCQDPHKWSEYFQTLCQLCKI
jgi:hypothetical protein